MYTLTPFSSKCERFSMPLNPKSSVKHVYRCEFLTAVKVIGSEGWEGSEVEQIDLITIPLLVLSLSNLYSDSPNVSKAAQLFSQVLSKFLYPSQTIEGNE